ncbi:MAG: hypothetical protein JSS86_24620 [Cyanobacteria bacterium SZAS LIN-2]|nr:hypothetical protein [Cyanobacteria bacterium SZAS LIN-2]
MRNRYSAQMRNRDRSGSILLLAVLLTLFVVIPVLIAGGQMALYQVDRVRAQTVVEGAGLMAANDLSRIVINDPHFGYVSLSNYPPIGKGTCAPDGEPLPVLGINTLVGTIRQNTLIAHELNNNTMATLADIDKAKMDATIERLNTTLKDALANKSGGHWSDIQGNRVEPLKDVTAFLKANLPANIRLESVTITPGWLSNGGDSAINVPQPTRLAQLKEGTVRVGKYQAFTDIPAVGRTFTFAGVGSSSSLVSAAKFQKADGKHINSIVKIECTFSVQNLGPSFGPLGFGSGSKLTTVACCQPFAMPDIGPAGALTLRFTQGTVAGLQTWSDFLAGGFHDNQVSTYDAVGGDYPLDPTAHMQQNKNAAPSTTSQQFAEHLYYWLRNGHTKPRIDSVLAMINDPFRSGPAQIYAYEFARDGTISRRIIARDPFPVGVTSEAQAQTVADTSIQGGLTPIIIFRDDVKNLGTESGGQHAGQPLPGYPLNWCELPEYGGDEQCAAKLNKGHLGTRLTLVDPSGQALPEEAINDPNFSLFQNFDGKTLFHQPRRSFYSGGLALDIEIGGTGDPAPVTQVPQTPAPLPAILDIPSKRWIFANRKI